MNNTVTCKHDIPQATFYVLCNDTFMSGWGYSKERTNTLIFCCDSYDQAEIVAYNARNRSDQRRIRIIGRKAIRLYHDTHFYQYKTIEDYPHWYDAGYFAK